MSANRPRYAPTHNWPPTVGPLAQSTCELGDQLNKLASNGNGASTTSELLNDSGVPGATASDALDSLETDVTAAATAAAAAATAAASAATVAASAAAAAASAASAAAAASSAAATASAAAAAASAAAAAALAVANAHQSRHLEGGADALDADTVHIDHVAVNYTPTIESGVTTTTTQLTSQLNGIDLALRALPDLGLKFTADLIGMWFGDNAGGVITDSSAAHNNLNEIGGGANMRRAQPIDGTHLPLIGTGSYSISGATLSAMRRTGALALSIEFLICPMLSVGVNPLINCEGSAGASTSNCCWAVTVEDASAGNYGVVFRQQHGTKVDEIFSSGIHPVPGAWCHGVWTRDATGKILKLYLDGILVYSHTTATISSGGSIATTQMLVDVSGSNNWLIGAVSFCAVYTAERTAAEVTTLWRARKRGLS